MAVGIIVGTAFTNVVQSFVNDILTPPFGLLFGGVDFSNLTINMKNFVHKDQPDVVIRYGKFIQTLIYLIIVAFVLFFLIKAISKISREVRKRKKDQEKVEEVQMEAVNDELQVLREIRDLLAGKTAPNSESPIIARIEVKDEISNPDGNPLQTK